MKKIVLLTAATALIAAPAFADSLQFREIPLTGSPAGGYHTVDIGGATCKLKSSQVTGASAGCNYTLVRTAQGWTVENRSQPACSTRCE